MSAAEAAARSAEVLGDERGDHGERRGDADAREEERAGPSAASAVRSTAPEFAAYACHQVAVHGRASAGVRGGC